MAQQRAHRRPHAVEVGVLTNRFDQLGGARPYRLDEPLAGDVDCFEPFVRDGGYRLGSERTRDVTSRVTPHPIRDKKQMRPRISRILIARANSPDVAARDGKDARIHLRPQFKNRGADGNGNKQRDRCGHTHALIVNECSVGGVQVLNHPVAVPQLQTRMVG